MSKTIEEIRNEIAIDCGYKNFDQLLIFNDSCIVDIIDKTHELKEQNAELVEVLESIVNLQDKYFGENDIHRVLQKKVFEIEDILTKYNHLNKKQ